ncbi:MAG: hypothetical protein M3077_05200 [Candidatus Dormibacteraeota bacterium]|nr:hypothetical protein [Candidatus Dormibacteraeota bacterium]
MMSHSSAIEPWDFRAPPPPARWVARMFLVVALALLSLIAAAIFELPRIAAARRCVSPLALGTLVFGDQNGATVTVQRGATVTVRFVDYYTTHITRSTDQAVIRQVPLCPDPPLVSSLPVATIPFRAGTPGRADLRIFAAPAGSSQPDGNAEFLLHIIVPPVDLVPWLWLAALAVFGGILTYKTRSIWTRAPYTSTHRKTD